MLGKTVAGPLEPPCGLVTYLGYPPSLSPLVSWEATRSMILFPVQRVNMAINSS